MSISAPSRPSHPGIAARPRSRLVSGSFALVLVAALCMETSFFLLVSVTPMAAAADGANSTGAGLVTGVLLLGTVVAELASPVLMTRCGHRVTLAAGALLMGVPLLVLLAHGTFVVTMIASLARGFGFGLGAVVLGTLVPLLVPAAAVAWLPHRVGADDPGAASDQDQPIGLLAGLRQVGQRRPALIFAASTVAAGVVVSFLPLATGLSRNVAAAGLFAQALTGMAGRWWAGRLGDRLGHARLLPPALVIAAAGMAGLFWLASPVAVIAGMGLFGLGFGVLQNATFALMINRMPESGFGAASAIWNLAYDAGYGAGPAAFGVFVGVTGYPIAFAFSALLMVVALPLTRSPRPAGAARSARGGKRGEVVIQDHQRPVGRGVPGSGDELDAQPVE